MGCRIGRSRVRLTGLALGTCLLAGVVPAGATGAAQAAGGGPRTEKFTLVIEGVARARRHFTVNGEVGTCTEEASGTFSQGNYFLRGRGVTLEFVRKRHGSSWIYGVKRVGRRNAVFTVKVKQVREATGSAEVKALSIKGFTLPCPESGVKHDLDTPGCGTTKKLDTDLGLKISGTTFTVAPGDETLAAPIPLGTCGETTLTKGFLSLLYEWPDYVPVASAPLPEAKLFSGVHALAVKLSGEDKGTPKPIGTPPLTGTATDSGETDITVRFIRCGAPHLPACG